MTHIQFKYFFSELISNSTTLFQKKSKFILSITGDRDGINIKHLFEIESYTFSIVPFE